MKRKVRLHPLPAGAPATLAEVIGSAVAGAVRQALDAHTPLPKDKRGALVGSIRKRAVNQLVCAEGVARIRAAFEREQP